MKIHNNSAIGYKRAGENLGKALAASFPNATEIYVESCRHGNDATLLLDGRRIKLSGTQIDAALQTDYFGAPPMADKPVGLL